MLKALLLDMDETLCDTFAANESAKLAMAASLRTEFALGEHASELVNRYVQGIYREWTKSEHERYMPIIEKQSENHFRVQLIKDLLHKSDIRNVDQDRIQKLQNDFDHDRLQAFDFFPGIKEFLKEVRHTLCLVVITNGPEFSQIPKVNAVSLHQHVDHIIIGGQEPAQKPATSIFTKALHLADCEAHEALHIGDSIATDIIGAHDSGITSIWVKHQQKFDEELSKNPSHIVDHPKELPALVRKLMNK
ncbi:MAG: N-acylneuraminate-9-phosphatase [Flavobacteriales bacterium]|jgi:N-acylneuraminate-9-phosphatase